MIPVVLDPGSKVLDHRALIWDFVFLWVDVAKERSRPVEEARRAPAHAIASAWISGCERL
jgi:hypothetical protein